MILDIRGRRGCRPQRRQGHPSPRGLATKRRLGNRFRIRRDRANVAGHGTSSPAGAGSGGPLVAVLFFALGMSQTVAIHTPRLRRSLSINES